MRIFLAILVVLLASPSTHLAAADAWPTTRIDVYKGDSGFFSEDDEAELPGDSEVRKLEDFLSYAAERMEAWGFPAPALQLIESEACAACYRIYLDEIVFGGGDAAGVTSNFVWTPSAGEYDVTTIDRNKALKDNDTKIRVAAYITGAHELFHTVQHSTPYLSGGEKAASRWISEGTAEAVALYLLESYPKRATIQPNEQYIEGVNKEKQYGGRLYSLPLPVEERGGTSNPMGDYRSSSFWRYLAEIAASRNTSGRASMPGPAKEDADFSYLVELFGKPNAGNSLSAEITWLDQSLWHYDLFAQKLGETHARFLSTLAGYADYRYVDRKMAQDEWLQMFFGKCVTVSFKPGAPSRKQVLDLRGMAGRCVEVRQVGGTDAVQFDLQIETGSEAETEQLWVGEPGGQVLSRRHDRLWDETIDRDRSVWFNKVVRGSAPVIFIVTNAADTASTTRPVSATVQVTFNQWTRPGAPAPRAAPATDPGPDGRSDALKKRVEAAGGEMTTGSAYTMQIQRDESVMHIRLSAVPMVVSAAFTPGGSGGFMDQILTSGEGVEAAASGVMAAYFPGGRPRQQQAGEEVAILIPRIEYGFTGTIPGARIYTTDSDGTPLFAVGPQDSQAGPQREFRPSGTVTISHFSPEYLSGSYHADFVDPGAVTPSQMQQSRPTLDIRYSAGESFVVSAPWTTLDRTDSAMPVNMWDEVEADLLKRMPPDMADIGRAMVEEARSASEDGRDPDFSAITSVNNPASAACDCSCSGMEALTRMGEAVDAAGRAPTAAERELAACGMACSKQYAVCEAD